MKKADRMKNKLRFLIIFIPLLVLGIISFLIISFFHKKRGDIK